MPKLSLAGDNKLRALLTWSKVKLTTIGLKELSDECSFKEAAAELNVQRRQTCSGRTENENDSQPLVSLWELKSLINLTSPRRLFHRNAKGDKVCQSGDTSTNPYERACAADERFFAIRDAEPLLERPTSPDLDWSGAINSHLISLTQLDDDCTADDTDESYFPTGPRMAELMKEAHYQQQHPDCFVESDFPAHDFHEMVSDLPSSPTAIKSDKSLAFLLQHM